MKKEILDFIHRRWSKDSDWCNGNCLWFAFILHTRFPELKIYYLPIEGHFVVGYDDLFFDWCGVCELKEEPIEFSKIQSIDNLWYDRLIKDL